MTLTDELLKVGVLRCRDCLAALVDAGYGEDEYGPHRILICPNCRPELQPPQGEA